MAKKYYTLVLNFGYVENQSLSYMPWRSQKPFANAKDAVVDLATFLRDKFLEQNEVKPKKCCVATKEKDSAAEFCTKCGHALASPAFDGENFVEWLQELSMTDVDSFHSVIEWNPEEEWQVGHLEKTPNQRFVYQAEWVLACAVGHDHREGKTFEVICKDRTKNRSESFTYY